MKKLKLVSGDWLVEVVEGTSNEEVATNIVLWLDQASEADVNGITVERSANDSMSLWIDPLRIEENGTVRHFDIFGEAAEVFANYAVATQGDQWTD